MVIESVSFRFTEHKISGGWRESKDLDIFVDKMIDTDD